MRVLGIESASLVASAAIVEDSTVLAECTTNYKKTHSETLLPMIDRLVSDGGISLSTVDYIAVSAGPGSFTGLRIGAASGKGLAFALGKPMIAVPTLDAMAYGCFGIEAVLCPLMDARRGEIYAGLYTYTGGDFKVWQKAQAVPLAEQIRQAEALGETLGLPVMYLGDGLSVHEKDILRLSGKKPLLAPASLRFQRGVCVAQLGMRMAENGETVSAVEFLPVYLRQSQAERERLEQGLSIEPVYE